MIVKMALCDDNIDDLEMMEQEIASSAPALGGWGYETKRYLSGNDLMKDIDEVLKMQILFLDIDMPGVSGMDIARCLETMSHSINIIFVTNREDLVFEAIQYSPFRFIRKKCLKTELSEALENVTTEIKDQLLFCEVDLKADQVQIQVKDVMYLESKGHYVKIHKTDKTIETVRAKITDFEQKLERLGFVRTHVSYLVNLRKIYSITSQEICLDNGETVPVSRKQAEHVKAVHAEYVRRFLRGIS